MRTILIIDTNRRFLSDIQSRIILIDLNGIEIEVSAMVDSIHGEVERIKPDELVIPSYLADSHPNWDFGIPVRCFARDEAGLLDAEENGLECYGVISNTEDLLNAISEGKTIKITSKKNKAKKTEIAIEQKNTSDEADNIKQIDADEEEDVDDILMTQMNNSPGMQSQQIQNQQSMHNYDQYQQDAIRMQEQEEQQNNFRQMHNNDMQNLQITNPQNPPNAQNPYPYPYMPYQMMDANGKPMQQMFDANGNPVPMMPPVYYDQNGNPVPYPYQPNPYGYPYQQYQGNGQNQNGQNQQQNPYQIHQMQQMQQIQQDVDQQQIANNVNNQPEEQNTVSNEKDTDKKNKRRFKKNTDQKSDNQTEDILGESNLQKANGNVPVDVQVERDLGNVKGPAKVVTVYSAKGGVGKTTIACELATYLSLISHGRGTFNVCIADYNIDFGDVISTLDFDPNGSNMSHWNDDIKDKVESGIRPEDITYTQQEIRAYIQTNATDGLNALIAPITNEDSMRISDVELEVMMRNLINNGGFDYVIFDTGNNTRDSSFLALEYADIILLVLTQNVATANCNVGFLNTFQKMGYDLNKVYTVINKVKSAKSVGISTQELEEAFVDQKTNRILTCLSHIKDSNDVRKSYNLAEPLVYNSAHEFTKDIGKIASFVIGDNFALEAPQKEGFMKRVFGRKRK